MYLLHKRYLWIVVYSIVSNLMNTAAYTHTHTLSPMYTKYGFDPMYYSTRFFFSIVNQSNFALSTFLFYLCCSCNCCEHEMDEIVQITLSFLQNTVPPLLFWCSVFDVLYTTLKNIIIFLLLCLSAEHFSIITFLLDCKPCNWHTQWLLVAHKHSKSMQWPTAATRPTSTTYSATVLPKQWSSWYIIHFDFSERVFPMHIDFFHPTRKSLSLSRALSPSPYLCLSWNFVRK